MATFNTKKTLYGPVSLIPNIAKQINDEFSAEGFQVHLDQLTNGGYDISITKGGVFKAVLGMQSALKVSLLPETNGINFDAGVGIFGQQAIPTVISMFFFWPVLITQIWGMIDQAKLDDKALAIAERVINANVPAYPQSSGDKFCTQCGAVIPGGAAFCPKCGCRL
jgi:hypothetical protein